MSVLLVKNRRASFDYIIIERLIAGIQLKGSEVKAIRDKKISIAEAFCYIKDNEVYLKNSHISEHTNGGKHCNHSLIRDRKLLLMRKEINNLSDNLKQKNLTLIPLSVLLSENGYIKIEIGLAKGRNSVDKRNAIKEKELTKEIRNIK